MCYILFCVDGPLFMYYILCRWSSSHVLLSMSRCFPCTYTVFSALKLACSVSQPTVCFDLCYVSEMQSMQLAAPVDGHISCRPSPFRFSLSFPLSFPLPLSTSSIHRPKAVSVHSIFSLIVYHALILFTPADTTFDLDHFSYRSFLPPPLSLPTNIYQFRSNPSLQLSILLPYPPSRTPNCAPFMARWLSPMPEFHSHVAGTTRKQISKKRVMTSPKK